MDFSVADTPELAAFRKEVQAWMEKNGPRNFPADEKNDTPESYAAKREFHRKLGKKGWRAPWLPVKYGGADLSLEKATIVDEEISRLRLGGLGGIDDNGPGVLIPGLMTYGNEEQRMKFLLPSCRGEMTVANGQTEPESGSDLASLRTTAIRDGDSYVLNGQKIFQARPGGGRPDFSYLIAITNPDRPRHHNLGVFVVPLNVPGVSISPMRLIGTDRNVIYYDNARVPLDCLVGQEGQGWQVASAQLEIEHGFGGISPDEVAPEVLNFLRQGPKNGSPLAGDPLVRDRYAELYIGVNVNRLFQMRNFSQRVTKQFGNYEGSQLSVHTKTFRQLRQAQLNLETCGLYALMDDEKEAPVRAYIEQHQRSSIATHPIGTIEVHKVIMARRMGLSATQERAAATV
ncbi:MAG: acyl-CoA dehydrogenase family protein [Chloroflexi bacterium]|nr:acyl-CoA dehydrogenase family protein [Chloroflexota bacterium]